MIPHNCVICGDPTCVDTPVCLMYSTVQKMCNRCFFHVLTPTSLLENVVSDRVLTRLRRIEHNFQRRTRSWI